MSRFAGKTILVTGATGLIGSHIVDAFMAMGDVSVIALARSAEKIEKGFAEYLGNHNFKYIVQDISEPLNKLDTTINFIFHAAGPMENKIIENCPLDVIKANVFGTQNCLDYLQKQEIEKNIKGRMVVFSSVTVYGNMSNEDIVVSEADTAVTEALETTGEPYSQSKRISEVIARAYKKQFNTDVVIARLSTVYGDTRFLPDTAFFEFIKKATSGEHILIKSSGLKRRDNIYIDDAVAALICILEKGNSGEVYNVSSNGELNNFAAIDEIADIIADVSNQKFKRPADKEVKVLYKEHDVSEKRKAGIILDNRKLKSLGWSLVTDLRTGVQMTIDSYCSKK